MNSPDTISPDEVHARAAELDLEEADLDDTVHDTASTHASQINDEGLAAQLDYLIQQHGAGGALALLNDL